MTDSLEAAMMRYTLANITVYNIEPVRDRIKQLISDFIAANSPEPLNFVGTHVAVVDQTTEEHRASRVASFSIEPLTEEGREWLAGLQNSSCKMPDR